jgi:carbonic anhydrase/acetyltransferase-like protein (isoleucine patch superfamily)
MSLYAFEGKTPQVADDAYVHPCATVIGAVTIGSSCFIGPGAVLRGDSGVIEIGMGTSIQDNCVVHADKRVVISDNIIVGHGAIIHDVILKSRVMVGMGALLMNGVIAEEEAVIGAGTLVREGVTIPAGKIMVGNPGRIVKEIDEEGKKKFSAGLLYYQELARRYSSGLELVEA